MTRVTVFGANGATGREIVQACVRAGHEVVAAVRRPETMAGVDGVTLRRFDLSDHALLVEAMRGSDVVVSCLGHGSLSASKKFTDLYSSSTRAYLQAMAAATVRRIITLSSGGTVEDAAAPWFYTRLLRRYLLNTYVDMARMETMLECSDTEWTAVRLTYLKKGPSKPFLVREGRLGGGSFQIHYVDAGKFVADEITERRWVRKFPVLGYP